MQDYKRRKSGAFFVILVIMIMMRRMMIFEKMAKSDFHKFVSGKSNLINLFQGDSLSLAFISGQSEAVLVR